MNIQHTSNLANIFLSFYNLFHILFLFQKEIKVARQKSFYKQGKKCFHFIKDLEANLL